MPKKRKSQPPKKLRQPMPPVDGMPLPEPEPEPKGPVRDFRTLIRFEMDHDLLEWFIKAGPGYQSRMHSVLAAYAKSRGFGRRKREKKISL